MSFSNTGTSNKVKEDKKNQLDSNRYLILYILNVAKNILGSFMIFVPWTLSKSGIIIGSLQMLLTYFLCVYTFCLIAYLGMKTKAESYSKMFIVFGKWFVYLVDFSIFGITICANAGYLILIRDSIFPLWNEVIPKWAIVVIFAYAICFPISQFKKLTSIKFFSLITLIGIIVIIISVLVIFIAKIETNSSDIYLVPTSGVNFIISFPIMAGTLDCHTNALQFYLEYHNDTTKKKFTRFVKTIFAALFIVMFATMSFSIIAYLTIGNSVLPNALNSYTPSPLITTLKIIFVCSIVVSYSLFINSIRISTHNFIEFILDKNITMDLKVRLFETFGIISLTAIMAIFITDIGYFNACAWGIFGSLLVYIYPTILAIKLKTFKNKFAFAWNIFVLVFGVAISCLAGFVTSLIDWINSINSAQIVI